MPQIESLLICFPAISQHRIFFWNLYCFYSSASLFQWNICFPFPFPRYLLLRVVLPPYFLLIFPCNSCFFHLSCPCTSLLWLYPLTFTFLLSFPLLFTFQSNLCFLYTLKRKKVDHGGWAYVYIYINICLQLIQGLCKKKLVFGLQPSQRRLVAGSSSENFIWAVVAELPLCNMWLWLQTGYLRSPITICKKKNEQQLWSLGTYFLSQTHVSWLYCQLAWPGEAIPHRCTDSRGITSLWHHRSCLRGWGLWSTACRWSQGECR